jgi:hypothetical protein
MKIILPALSLFFAVIPASHAWTIAFHQSNDCSGPSIAGFGDKKSDGCTPLGINAVIQSADLLLNDNPYQFHMIVYENADCTGASCDLYQAQNNNCCKSSKGWQSFRTA